MESDLRKLIDDRLFRNYHREFLKPREFNTFDVLRYADYRQKPSQYPMKDSSDGWCRVYDQKLVSNDELADMSGSATKDQVLQRLTDFMESDESEYRRIDNYFQCLAFRPDESASTQKDSP